MNKEIKSATERMVEKDMNKENHKNK